MIVTQNSLSIDLPIGFDAAVEGAAAALEELGFKVLTQADIGSSLWVSSNGTTSSCAVLVACHTVLFQEVLSGKDSVDMLPLCNIMIYQRIDGTCRVVVADPRSVIGVPHDGQAVNIAGRVRDRLGMALLCLQHDVLVGDRMGLVPSMTSKPQQRLSRHPLSRSFQNRVGTVRVTT